MFLVLDKLYASGKSSLYDSESRVNVPHHMHPQRPGSCRHLPACTSPPPLRSLEVAGTSFPVRWTDPESTRPADLACLRASLAWLQGSQHMIFKFR
jgi:hypothetical protein